MHCWLTHVVSADYLEARMWTWGRCCVRPLRRRPRPPSSPARPLLLVTTQELGCGPTTNRRGLTLTSHLRNTLLLAETEATLSTSSAELRVSTVTKVNNASLNNSFVASIAIYLFIGVLKLLDLISVWSWYFVSYKPIFNKFCLIMYILWKSCVFLSCSWNIVHETWFC